MWKIIASFLYSFTTISNASGSNSVLLENKVLPARNYKYVGEEELQFVVSVGVFKDANYIHVCLAVMITGLNGITSGMCGDYDYYAKRAGLIQSEKNLTEENRTKLYVNTKRPIHLRPDKFYAIDRFIDFKQHCIDHPEEKRSIVYYDIGVFTLTKKVQHTRPMLNVPVSTIKELPVGTVFTLTGMNTIEERPSGEKMLMKKSSAKMGEFYRQAVGIYLKPYQFCIGIMWCSGYILSKDDIGGPVYWENQFVGILVDSTVGLVTIDATLDEYIDGIIASTWVPRMRERKPKETSKASTSSATAS